ncbi:MAG: hypothetical protein M0Q91_10595 [Methanoregula sp.]|nr:hypothetical protein [Methanoregula sp.]
MKVFHLNKYSTAAILFLVAAVVFIVIALITSLGEFITAAFVISGMVCLMTGIFMLTFSGSEPIEPKLVGLLPVQGCMNLCRIALDLDIHGNAHFLPPRVSGEARVMQFNPTLPYDGTTISAQKSLPETGPQGLVTIPSCDPLIQLLMKRNELKIPDNNENLTQLIREATGEIFEFAPRVSARWHGNTVTLTFHQYRFIAGCHLISRESPGCCARQPCPACSLCGALIAAGTDKVVALQQCSVSASASDVNLVFWILPLPDLNPHV